MKLIKKIIREHIAELIILSIIAVPAAIVIWNVIGLNDPYETRVIQKHPDGTYDTKTMRRSYWLKDGIVY